MTNQKLENKNQILRAELRKRDKIAKEWKVILKSIESKINELE